MLLLISLRGYSLQNSTLALLKNSSSAQHRDHGAQFLEPVARLDKTDVFCALMTNNIGSSKHWAVQGRMLHQ